MKSFQQVAEKKLHSGVRGNLGRFSHSTICCTQQRIIKLKTLEAYPANAAGNLHRDEFCLYSDSLANRAANCGECARCHGPPFGLRSSSFAPTSRAKRRLPRPALFEVRCRWTTASPRSALAMKVSVWCNIRLCAFVKIKIVDFYLWVHKFVVTNNFTFDQIDDFFGDVGGMVGKPFQMP